MPLTLSRRTMIRLAAVGGGVVFASRLGIRPGVAATEEFYFVQLSDIHWGFQDATVNPDPRATLEKAIAAINAAPHMPDFIVFTGDLTHMTKDAQERRRRMGEVRAMLGTLKVSRQFYLPGEHDAALDRGAAFQELFGPLHQAFDHKGLHFVALDNTSDPHGLLGDAQLAWLAADLKGRDPDLPVVVLAHRPLFALKPDWDWFTRDGDKAIQLLTPFKKVTVFYGHIHQQNTHRTGAITHIAARSAMYPLPAPGSAPKKAPLPWNAGAGDHGIGWREIDAEKDGLQVDDRPTA
jgi:3',5'-cyclic AMP phosphodiesterase CpdA